MMLGRRLAFGSSIVATPIQPVVDCRVDLERIVSTTVRPQHSPSPAESGNEIIPARERASRINASADAQ
jgi:hypothetical protein